MTATEILKLVQAGKCLLLKPDGEQDVTPDQGGKLSRDDALNLTGREVGLFLLCGHFRMFYAMSNVPNDLATQVLKAAKGIDHPLFGPVLIGPNELMPP